VQQGCPAGGRFYIVPGIKDMTLKGATGITDLPLWIANERIKATL